MANMAMARIMNVSRDLSEFSSDASPPIPAMELSGSIGVDLAHGRPACGRPTKRGSVMGASVLISILITFLVIILVLYLINMLPIDGRAKQTVRIIVIIIGVLSMLKYLAIF